MTQISNGFHYCRRRWWIRGLQGLILHVYEEVSDRVKIPPILYRRALNAPCQAKCVASKLYILTPLTSSTDCEMSNRLLLIGGSTLRNTAKLSDQCFWFIGLYGWNEDTLFLPETEKNKALVVVKMELKLLSRCWVNIYRTTIDWDRRSFFQGLFSSSMVINISD